MKKTFRKIAAVLIAAVIVFGAGITTAFAASVDEKQVTSNAAMLIDQYTGEVLYQKNQDEKIRPASTTKIMTAVVTLEKVESGAISLDDVVTVGSEINTKSAKGSNIGLVVGDKLKLQELLYGLIMHSGNDAALVIAKYVGGTVDDFVKLMNEKAQQLGMNGSHFANPHGMDDDDHYVTCADMAKLAKYATKFSLLKTIGSTTTHSIPLEGDGKVITLTNTNYLIYHDDKSKTTDYTYKYATGLKTGQTPKAGSCLVATGEKDGQKLIALVYGDESKSGTKRWTIAKYLLQFGFDNYVSLSMEELAEKCGNLIVTVPNAASSDEGGGKLKCMPVVGDDENDKITLTTEQVESGINAKITPADGLTAPVNEGDVVGTVTISVGDKELFSGNLAATRSVYSATQVDKGENSVVTTMSTIDLNDTKVKIQFKDMWFWLLIPAALIVFLIVRGFVVKGRRHRRRSMGRYGSTRRRGGYSYGRGRRRRRF